MSLEADHGMDVESLAALKLEEELEELDIRLDDRPAMMSLIRRLASSSGDGSGDGGGNVDGDIVPCKTCSAQVPTSDAFCSMCGTPNAPPTALHSTSPPAPSAPADPAAAAEGSSAFAKQVPSHDPWTSLPEEGAAENLNPTAPSFDPNVRAQSWNGAQQQWGEVSGGEDDEGEEDNDENEAQHQQSFGSAQEGEAHSVSPKGRNPHNGPRGGGDVHAGARLAAASEEALSLLATDLEKEVRLQRQKAQAMIEALGLPRTSEIVDTVVALFRLQVK